MSKRDRHLKQRLNELFTPAADEAPPAAPEPPARPKRAARPIGPTTAAPVDLPYLAAAIKQLPLPAYLKDREHTWVAVNAAFAQLLGQTAEALTGRTDKEQADDAWQLDDRVLDGGQEETSHETTPLPDGTICTRRTRRTPLTGNDQTVRYVMGVVEELVTPLPGIGSRPPESAETFHAAMDAIPSPIIVSRIADDVIVYANQAFSDFTALPLAQLLGQRAVNFYADPNDRERVVQGVRQHGELHGFEVRMRRADGHTFWVSLSIRRLKFNGEACVITTLEDISTRKQAELELTKFKLGIDRSYYSVMITAVDGTILYVNPAFTKIYSYTTDEAIGRKPSLLKSGEVTPDQYARFWNRLLAGEIVTGEIINKTKDGRLIPVETNNSPILDESGQLIGFISMQSDISARKQAEEDLLTRNRQLATFNRVGQELTQLVSAQEVVEYVFAAMGEILDNRNLYIALYDERKQEISFPIYTMDGERRTVAGRPFGNGITEHVLHTKKMLWIRRDVQGFAASIGSASIGRPSKCYLGVPLLSGDKALGVIAVQDYDREDSYSAAEGELLSAIAAQTAAALENVRLYATESRRAVQLQTAAEISTVAGTVLDINELLPVVVDLIQQRFNLCYAGLFLMDETRENAVLRAGTGEAGQRMLERKHQLRLDEHSMIGWCIRQQTPRIALDVGEDAVRFNNPDLPQTRSELALPLISRGQVLGAMTVQSTEAAAFSEQDIAILQTMSDQVATAIANAQLFEEARQARQQAEARLRETQFLLNVGQVVSSSPDLSGVMDVVMHTLEQELGFTHNALYLMDRQTGVVTTPRAAGTAVQLQGLTRSLEQLQGDILLDILNKGQLELIDGWDERLDREIYETQGHAALVRAFVPLRLRGESIGLLEVGYRRTSRARITPEEVHLLSGLADQIAIAVENARLLEQAQTALAETTRRSAQLAVLNEMGRALGLTLDAESILRSVYTYTSRLMNTQSFFIALYDSESDLLSFPLSYSYNDNQPVQVESRPLKSGLTDYVIRQRQPLLLTEDIPAGMAKLGLEFLAFGNAQPALSWLGVPLIFGEQVLGAIVVQSITTAGLYREIERDLLLAVAGQAAIALNNARLFDESQQRITELAVVNEISRTLTATQDVQQLFATIHEQVRRLYDASNFYIATYDGGAEWSLDYQVEHGQVLPPARHKLGAGFTSYILQTRQSILIRSIQENLAFHDRQNLPKIGESARSWMGVPLIVGGSIIGVMGIQSYKQEGLYTEQDIALFSTIATQAATAIQNARLFQEARLRAAELTALNELSQTLAAQLSVNQVLHEVWQGVSHLLDTTNFYIALYDQERAEISFPINASESVLDKEIEVMPADQGLTGYIIRTRQPLLITEDTDQRVAELGLTNIGGTSQSYLGVPLILGEQVLGVMAIQSYDRARLYNEHDQNLLTAIAGQAAIALQNARLFEQIQKQGRETTALNEIIQEVSQRVDLDHVLETAYKHIRQLLPTDTFIVALLTGNGFELHYPLIYDEGQRFPPRGGEARPETNIGRVILTGQPLLINRPLEELQELSETTSSLGNLQRPSASLLYAPLKSEQKTVGALSIQSYQLSAYTADNVALFERIANQLAVAIQNAQLFAQTQTTLAETEQLYAASQRLTAATNLPEAVAAMAEGIPVADINRAALWLFERDEQDQVVAALITAGWYSGQGVPVMPTGTRLSAEVIKAMPLLLTTEPLFSNDLKTDQRIDPGTAAVLQQQQIGAIAILPLWVVGRQIGAFLLEAEGPHIFVDTEIRPYISLSRQLATTIYNQQLLEQTQRGSRQLAALNELGQVVSQQIEIEQILEVTYQRLQQLFSVDAFLAVLYDRETNTISFPIMYDEGRRYSEPTLPFNPLSVTGQVISTGESILKLLTAEQLAATSEVKGALGNVNRPSASLIYVPLKIGPQTIGVLSVQSYQLNAYDLDTVQFVSSVANQVSISIQNAWLLDEARARARREQTLREITSRVRNSTEPDTIVRAAVRELGIALGRQTFIRLGDAEQLSRPPQTDRDEAPASGNGHQAGQAGGQ